MAMNPRLLVPRAVYDPDAAKYLAAVEAADGQALETPVKRAVDGFIRDCKAAGIFDAIKASCILCGARTLSGALVPLKGTAPTNNNFVAADYNRETGLVGNGSTKWLGTNLAYNAISSNDEHLSLYISTAIGNGQNAIGGGRISPICVSRIAYISVLMRYDIQSDATETHGSTSPTGFVAVNRSASDTKSFRDSGSTTSFSENSEARADVATPYGVFVANYSDIGQSSFSSTRLAFYSIGESLDLEALDDAVSALVTAIGAAI